MSRILTQDNIPDMLHLRDENKKLLPQEFSFFIVPDMVIVQIENLEQELKASGVKEEKRIIEEYLLELKNTRDSADRYKGHYLPIKLGEWSKYVKTKYEDLDIVREHLCNEKGELLLKKPDEDLSEFLNDRYFVSACALAIKEASQIQGHPFVVRAIQIEEDLSSARKKLQFEMLVEQRKKENEKKQASQEKKSVSHTSSESEVTTGGSSENSPS